ncbi:Arm DNA-binding domain-containing protein [Photobacterium carnosum]|uniref:Arm DNA-binding domain-containing protein n=1 Tax=Photobacterium carnosum TaxID=2023717 RepID=UPI001E5C8E2D|nr:DUF3596 domain-containing protein [Photobacterium carnosum]MCD9529102.1 DUF3596 domain-containing protein [Photobacterium carnosum]
MANYRIRPNGIIQYDIHIYGRRFRETTGMPATPKNIKIAKATVKQINAEINLNTFQYRDYFPDSKKVELFEALQQARFPDRFSPYFDNFANNWLERQKPKWKQSYYNTVVRNLNNYLKPEFGNLLVDELTLNHLEHYRQRLSLMEKEDGSRQLSNARINNILWPLISIMSLAADEYHFPYPFARYKALREEKSDSNPMTLEEVKCFLHHVDAKWYDYFLLRFMTGMRSCEVHGLQLQHIDFNHRLIRIRQNVVNGDITDVKTPKSRRDLPINDILFESLKRVTQPLNTLDAFLFSDETGRPLDTRKIGQKVWHPTLKKAGLSSRRPYETRHTAAVLHLAAHENPLYVSKMLGHSSTKLLFEIYAPYVFNAARCDGSAFSNMMESNNVFDKR